MAKLVHMMLRVLDERRSVEFYERAFGLKTADRFEFATFTLVYLQSPEKNFELELTINKDRTEPYSTGNGYGHLAFVVDDLDAHHAHLLKAQIAPEPIKSFEHGGRPLARFFFVTDPDGYRVEVLQRAGRFN